MLPVTPPDPVYSEIVRACGALLEDQPKAWADENYLLPHIVSAQNFVLMFLIDNEIPTMRVRTGAITIPAGTTVATTLSVPALPPLMEVPMAIWEAGAGAPSSEYRPLPGPFPHDPSLGVRNDTLGSWDWSSGYLQFTGATVDRDVMIDYVKVLDELTVAGPNVAFSILGAKDAIALLAASFVASSKGQSQLAADLGQPTADRLVTGRAGFALSTLVNIQKMAEQGPVQRRPYITRYRRPW